MESTVIPRSPSADPALPTCDEIESGLAVRKDAGEVLTRAHPSAQLCRAWRRSEAAVLLYSGRLQRGIRTIGYGKVIQVARYEAPSFRFCAEPNPLSYAPPWRRSAPGGARVGL